MLGFRQSGVLLGVKSRASGSGFVLEQRHYEAEFFTKDDVVVGLSRVSVRNHAEPVIGQKVAVLRLRVVWIIACHIQLRLEI